MKELLEKYREQLRLLSVAESKHQKKKIIANLHNIYGEITRYIKEHGEDKVNEELNENWLCIWWISPFREISSTP